jgi:DNA-binding winged helix-turn-helix (wHTH) protein
MRSGVRRFGRFRLDAGRRRLETTDGRAVPLAAKAFDALVYLVDHPGEPVSRKALLEALWPNTVVEENNLSQTISALRKALGPGYIVTLPGRGYQLVAEPARADSTKKRRAPPRAPPAPLPPSGVPPAGLRPSGTLAAWIHGGAAGAALMLSALLAAWVVFAVRGAPATDEAARSPQQPAAFSAGAEPQLDPSLEDPLRQRGMTSDVQAYELYLTAQDLARRSDFLAATRQLALALGRDPHFARAWAAKAQHHALARALVPFHEAGEHVEQAIHAAERALELEPSLPEAYLVLGMLAMDDGDWLQTARWYEQALALGLPLAKIPEYSVLQLSLGDFDNACKTLVTHLDEDPDNQAARAFLIAALELSGNTAAAKEVYAAGEALHANWLGRTIEVLLRMGRGDSELPQPYGVGLPNTSPQLYEAMLAHRENRRAALAEWQRFYRDEAYATPAARVHLAAWAAYLGAPRLALNAMEDSVEEFKLNVWYLWLPLFEETRRQPGFEALIERLGLAEYWRHRGWPHLCRPLRDGFDCD